MAQTGVRAEPQRKLTYAQRLQKRTSGHHHPHKVVGAAPRAGLEV